MKIIIETKDGKQVEMWNTSYDPCPEKRERRWEHRTEYIEPIQYSTHIKIGDNDFEFEMDEIGKAFNALFLKDEFGL